MSNSSAEGDIFVDAESNKKDIIKTNDMASYMPMPITFDVHDDWPIYESRLQQFFIAYNIEDMKRKAAILLTALSSEAFRVLKNVSYPDTPENLTYSQILDNLRKQFSRVVSVFSERSKFYETKQQHSETVNDWVARLKSMSMQCKFDGYLENVLRDKFVSGLIAGPIYDRVIELSHTSKLDKCVEIALAKEVVQREKISTNDIHQIKKKGENSNQNQRSRSSFKGKACCYACGKGDHDFKSCVYKQYKCKQCKQVGHLAKVCKSKKANYALEEEAAETTSDESEVDFGHIHTISNLNNLKTDVFLVDLKINNETIPFEIDTGSSVSVCSDKFYNEKCARFPISKVRTILKTYDGQIIKPVGVFDAVFEYNKKKFVCPFLVIRGGGRPLVGRDFLRLVNPSLNANFINNLKHTRSNEVNGLLCEFEDLFSEVLGRYKFGKVNIELKDHSCKPVFCKPRSVPLSFQAKFNAQLAKMVDSGMLRKIDFSEWGTPLVPVLKKNGDLRICADYKITVNPHIKDFQFSLPLIEDLFAALNGGELFSKLDMRDAYNQLELDESSQMLLAWSTQEGLYAPTRLIFGISPACAIFQSIMSKTLQGCNGVICFLDDILITGRSNEEHLQNLKGVFMKLRDAGFKLKGEKCEFFQQRVAYLGYIIDKAGLHKDPSKVEAVIEAPAPTTVTQIKAFVSLVGYYSKFIPNMAQVLAPIYALLRKNSEFVWNEHCENAFRVVKNIIASEKVLIHYDQKKPVKLVCDAALHGIGAAIFHVLDSGEERPIAFASRTLTKAELNYSATDREALAIFFGVKKFQHYLLGRHFILHTDHKPLVSIFGTKTGIPAMAAGRLQRWSVFLSNFDFEIEYIRGNENVNADFLSRLPIRGPDEGFASSDEDSEASYLKFIASDEDKLINISEIKIESRKDIIISKVILFLQQGWPDNMNVDDAFKPFYLKKDELTIEDNVLMWGYRVVIPVKLRDNVLANLHAAHSGIVKMKSRARSYVWWPGIDSDIENVSRVCKPCQVNSPNPARAEISPWQLSSFPFQRVHVDFLGPFKEKYFFVILDSYSKWVEVIKMRGITATETVDKCRECFSRFGIPEVVVSDNGTQFTGSEFQTFCHRNGIRHVTSAPYKPQSNGAAENSVKTFKVGMSKLMNDQMNKCVSIDVAMSRHLFYYRSSVHSTTQETPFKLMFGREMKTQFDQLRPNMLKRVQDRIEDRLRKDNEGRRTNEFEEGDAVWIREYKGNSENWVEATVLKRIGVNMYQCKTNRKTECKRHCDQIKARSESIDLKPSECPAKMQEVNNEKKTRSGRAY